MRAGSSLICRWIRATSSCHQPRHVALAVVLGLLLGALPKSSLMFLMAGMICYLMPSHLLILVMVACGVTLLNPVLETTLGRIGLWSLTHARLSPVWMRLDRFPIVPWLGLHNTIVHGGMLLWMAIAIPVYTMCRIIVGALMSRSEFDTLLDTVATNPAKAIEASSLAEYQELRPQAGQRNAGKLVVVEQPSVIFDEPHSTNEVLERAASLAAWADDAISSLLQLEQGDERIEKVKPEPVSAEDDERWLLETTMEVVRLAEQTVSQQASLKSKSPQSMSTTATTVDTVALKSDVVLRRDSMPHVEPHVHMDSSNAGGVSSHGNLGQQSRSDQPREEALHYLLRHLKAIQEKVKTQ